MGNRVPSKLKKLSSCFKKLTKFAVDHYECKNLFHKLGDTSIILLRDASDFRGNHPLLSQNYTIAKLGKLFSPYQSAAS